MPQTQQRVMEEKDGQAFLESPSQCRLYSFFNSLRSSLTINHFHVANR